jgi:FMN phosphatase YigB (HAD superfamily)
MVTKSKKSTLIVFDIGNVLLRFSKERARQNFDRIEPGSGLPLVHAMWNAPLGVNLEKGKITGRDFLRLAGGPSGVRMGYPSFCRAFQDIFTPIPANIRLLVRLSKTYPTALLSNTSEIHWGYLFKTYPELRSVRWRFASHLMKRLKPDPGIYEQVAEITGFALNDIVYVDDHLGFVGTAKRLGIRAVCYDGKTPLKILFKKVGIV